MRTTEIQTQLSEALDALRIAEEQRRIASANLADKPSDTSYRNTALALTAQIREIVDYIDALQVALGIAREHDASDEVQATEQLAREFTKASRRASEKRAVINARAVDKAVANMASALADMAETTREVNENLQAYLSHVYNAASPNECERRLEANITFSAEATGEGYIIPALGHALGRALNGVNLPNINLRDWLQVGALPGPTIEEAATVCAERFAARIDDHVKTRLGSE